MHNESIKLVWTTRILILCFCLCTTRDVNLCSKDDNMEITAGQRTSITCKAEGEIQWRLHLVNQSLHTSIQLADCTEKGCMSSSYFSDIFSASVRDSDTKLITIDSENVMKVYDRVWVVSGTLECVRVYNAYPVGSSRCGLNYVYPSENVLCKGLHSSKFVTVSCVIGSIYSSRGIYTCQLIRLKNASENEHLETVDMQTSPTSDRITNRDVKVSGSCQFNTTLPPEQGHYELSVLISPGGRTYSVKLTTLGPYYSSNNSAAVSGGVIGAVVFVILAGFTLIAVKRRRKDGKGKYEQLWVSS